MKTRQPLTLLFALLLTSQFLNAQEKLLEPSQTGQLVYRGSWAPSEVEDPYQRKLYSLSRGHDISEELKQIKARNTKLKLQGKFLKENAEKGLRTNGDPTQVPRKPSVDISYKGNAYDGCVPPDNAVAVSDGGYIVSMINCNIEILNEGGTVFSAQDLSSFFNNANSFFFDPRVLYDRFNDRFIAVCLEGGTSSTSTVHLAFSSSNDPSQSWNFYSLSGDINSQGTWFDYPNIGYNNNDLFVSGNLFNDQDSFVEAVVLQINKNPGYSGGNITFSIWDNFGTQPFGAFTLVPAEYGFGGNQGNEMHLFSSKNAGGTEIRTYHIQGNQGSNPTLTTGSFTLPFNYLLQADAVQPNSSVALDVGDCRLQDAMRMGNTVHITLNTASQSQNNYAGVGYIRVDLNNTANAQFKVFHIPNEDMTYGSLASSATNSNSQETMALAQRSSSTVFNEMVAFEVDASFTAGSVVTLKSGNNAVDASQQNGVVRWGDYTGIQRKYNESSPPAFWVLGHYGNRVQVNIIQTKNVHDNQLLKIKSSLSSSNLEQAARQNEAKIYPNPVHTDFRVQFDNPKHQHLIIRVMDLKGSEVVPLKDCIVKPGPHELRFNTQPLSKGTYLLQIASDDDILATEKFIVRP